MGLAGGAYAVWRKTSAGWSRTQKTGTREGLIAWAEDWVLDPPAEVLGLAVVPSMLPQYSDQSTLAVWDWVRPLAGGAHGG